MLGRIVIMGSGETAPTMVKVHRALIEAAGPGSRAMLDTPFGFQANADDLTEKVQEYFAASVGTPLEVARWRRRDEPVADRERAIALLGRSSFVFTGPGSPTFALRQWRETPIPGALVDVVHRGGTVVMGSAAAVTAGAWAVPVYEIYKVGDEPSWEPGLDLMGTLAGLAAAVIPHYDNQEGGRHDTRYCYLGESRLEVMEGLLPTGTGIIGVDEHTAAIVDLESRTVSVHGAGVLTLRVGGLSETIPSGSSISIAEIAAVLTGESTDGLQEVVAADEPEEPVEASPATSLKAIALALRDSFDAALAARDSDGALSACLELEEAITAWSADTLQGSDRDVARSILRAMIVDLAAAATSGLQDPREAVAPLVEVAIDARRRVREAKDYDTSDAIRDGLVAAGIEVRDTPDGVEWDLA